MSFSQDHHPPLCHLHSNFSAAHSERRITPINLQLRDVRFTPFFCGTRVYLYSRAFDAVGACLCCSDLCVLKGVVHPLSLGQQRLLLIFTECSSVRQPLFRIYRAHTSHRKIQESHADLKPLTKFMIIYYIYYKNPSISGDILNIISCIKKCLTVSDCALVCTVTDNIISQMSKCIITDNTFLQD